jgi:hypothetical protein
MEPDRETLEELYMELGALLESCKQRYRQKLSATGGQKNAEPFWNVSKDDLLLN